MVIPTVGRDTLHRTLESIYAQRESRGVEVIVVGDTFGGKTPELERAEKHRGLRQLPLARARRRPALCRPAAAYRWARRRRRRPTSGFRRTTTSPRRARWPPSSSASARSTSPGRCSFGSFSYWGDTIWRAPQLALGNIDADCLVFPRWIAKTVEWGLRYEGDYDAACKAFELAAGDVAWCDQVISISQAEAEASVVAVVN